MSRVFGGSREKLLVSFVGQTKLSKQERDALRRLLEEQDS
ncbi:MAG: BlaI/MecI/CopY family transcriptional regulator [Planctomycetales bacterium]